MNESRELHSTVVCSQCGKFLFVRKEAPEWSLPGGKIEAQEGHLDAARRELKEETDLTLDGSEFLGHHIFENEEHYLYKMEITTSIQPRASGEIVECRWFTPQELEFATVKPNNRELLERASATIQKQGD